ncbi:ankyrin repeat domain-containing protein [Aspergillus lucknowensis]|uniref:Ankyrin repeat-containing domain protein n=1 Tax=Aspergillus lucknowensis TaxID=176173 RepID=A0ABR4M166_9EURO
MPSAYSPRLSLVRLPTEILLSIAEYLQIKALNSLMQTCRHLANLLNWEFYRLAAAFTFIDRFRRRSPLTWAAENGRLSVIRKLVDAGAEVSKLLDGFSALHYAVGGGHTDVVRLLIDAGADTSQTARDEEFPLVIAARHGHEGVLRLLLNVTNANTSSGQLQYKRALCRAVYFGHLHIVRFMLEYAGVKPKDSSAVNGLDGGSWLDLARDETLLYEAAKAGNCDMIRLLLRYGATVPPVHRRSNHPLIVATQNNHWEAIQLFIQAGTESKIALQKTSAHGRNEVAQFLLDSGADTHAAAKRFSSTMSPNQSGHSVTVRLFQKYGADINQPTSDGRTPLQIALEEFSPPEVIQTLLDSGADANKRGRGGLTALHTLVCLKRYDLFETFLAAGASLSTADDKGNTPLLLAVAVSNARAASIFLQCGADICTRDKFGRTPLHAAAANNSVAIVKMLLDAGADISATDDDGRIPLHFATLSSNTLVFKAILSKHEETEVDYLVRSRSGRTVLEMAAEGGHLSLVEMLIERGVEIAHGSQGYSPLHAAIANRHLEIAELLLAHGADPLILDHYGRTPIDWASDDGAVLNRLLRSCSDITYAPTEEAIQIATLKGNVVGFATGILNGQTWDYYKLAKCLVYLGDGDAARAVFTQAAKLGVNEDDLRYSMQCNACRKRLKDPGRSESMVLVCRNCHDLDLCNWGDGSPFVGFSSNAGFSVSRTDPADAENTQEWERQLHRLISLYS